MRHRFNVLRISLRTMLVLVALCAIGFKWHREIRQFGRDLLFYPWYRLDDEGSWPIDYLESELTFNPVAFSPDGKTLATVGKKEAIAVEIKQYRSSGDDTVGRKSRVTQTISLWDVPARRPAWETVLGDGIIEHLLFSADGKTVVTIDGNEPTSIFDGPPPGPAKAIRWNVADGRRLSTTFVNKTPIWSAALSPDGNTLAVGSGGFNRNPPGRLTLWNLRSAAKIAELEVGFLEVATLAYAPDGRSLAMGLDVRAEKPGKSVRHELTILDAATLRPRASLFKGEDEVKFLAFSADGSTLASAHDGGILRLWDAKTRRVRTTINDPVVVLSAALSGVRSNAHGRNVDIDSLALSPDGNTLAAGLGTVVAIWDGKTGQHRSYIKAGGVTSLSFGAGGRTLAIAEAENESPLIFDLETGYELDWSNRGFPSRKAAYWLAGLFILVSALALSRMKRRRRAHAAAKDAKPASAGGKRHRILIVGVGFGVSFLLVAGVFIYRTICARRLAVAIDTFELPADQWNDVWKEYPLNQTEKAVFKNFVDQAVFSPRCSRLAEHLGVQSHRDKKTKKFVMENLPSALVFRSRYRDGRGRGREVFVFKQRQSFPVPVGRDNRTIAITDERGRVLTWKKLGEISNFDSADLERAGDRLVLAIYSDDEGYYSTYRFDLAGDEIRPIRVEPFPNPKTIDALARIDRRGGKVNLNPKLGNSVEFDGSKLIDDDLAALDNTWDAIGGVKMLSLSQTRITGAGVVHLKKLSGLKGLALKYSDVDDAGLEHLSGLVNLETLDLSLSRITGAGLIHLKKLSSLKELLLSDTAVDDAGLAHLSGLVNLETLDLSATKVAGSGLKALRGLRKLKVLKLRGCPIKEKDLKPLKGLPNLKDIVVDAATR